MISVGTGVTDVNLDLAGTPGSRTGDGQADTVIINGTGGNDKIAIARHGGSVDVRGLAASVQITGADASKDRLIVNALVSWLAVQVESEGLIL